MVALLRGINVGGNRKVPMPVLCSLAMKVGFTDVVHYINSGNIVFEAGTRKASEVEELLEKAIEKHFKFHVDVIVRTATQWKKYAAGGPFPTAAKERPHLLHLGLSKKRCNKNIAELLDDYTKLGEKIKLVGDAIWVDFVGGSAKSKLTPILFEKTAGSPVTMRNWNTVLKLDAMLK